MVVALLGARCHYAVPEILFRRGQLERLFTDIHSHDWPARLFGLLPSAVRTGGMNRLMDRSLPGVDMDRVTSFPSFGLYRALAHSRRRNPGEIMAGWAADNRSFCQKVAKHGFGNAKGLYVFNGAGLELLEAAKEHGLNTIVEQTIAPYCVVEPLLADERARWSGWEESFEGTQWEPLANREKQEWQLADKIICGSDYVVEGVSQHLKQIEKCAVVPYGVDLEATGDVRQADSNRPLRVVFLGTLELRKGIQYLSQAATELKNDNVEIKAIGPIQLSEMALNAVSENIDVTGAVPRSTIPTELAWADIFVLPTLAEGSAIVVYEALAAGLPVITTPNAGSVVRDGIDGRIIPAQDPQAICQAIRELEADRNLVAEMSESAMQRSTEFTVARYGDRLLNEIQSLMK